MRLRQLGQKIENIIDKIDVDREKIPKNERVYLITHAEQIANMITQLVDAREYQNKLLMELIKINDGF